MSKDGVAGLRFPVRELCAESEALREIAAGFCEDDGPLRSLGDQLERIGERSCRREYALRLRPLLTKPTREYEGAGRSGGQEIYARIRGKWILRPVGRKGPKRLVAFAGVASAVAGLWPSECQWQESQDTSKRLAMWRIEIGAHDSPGCYFHCQVLGDRDEPPFPKGIPIPRLPSPFVTPASAVEFVLGELFQERWARAASGATSNHKWWRTIQEKRWERLMDWQRESLSGGESSPWMRLKAAKPPRELFVSS